MSIASPVAGAFQVVGSDLSYPSRVVAEVTQGNPEGNPCGFLPDADEFAHGMYAGVKNVGTGTLHDNANFQYNLAAHHHMVQSLAYEPLVRSTGGMAGLLASSACVAPLACMAMHAGWHEWREAPKQAAEFAEAEKILAAEQAFARELARKPKQALSAELAAFDAATTARIASNAQSMKAARFGGYVGKYSFLSGAAILGRIIFEIARNVGGASEGDTTNVHQAAKDGNVNSEFLEGTGLAANAFGCLAAGFAFMLGLSFVRKSKIFSDKWKLDAPHLASKACFIPDSHSEYKQFLKAKSAERANFARHFYGKNRLFMAGAGLYAAGTILPTCVKMLVAVGILNSKHVSANLLLGLFAAALSGALVMGIFSHQFFFGHPKLERYEQYAFKESPELDRRFLSHIDDFVFRNAKGEVEPAPYALRQGLAIREAAFTAIQRGEAIRNELLYDIAQATNHTYRSKTHIGDSGHTSLSLRQRFDMRFRKNRLKAEHVEAYLQQSQNRAPVIGAYQRILDEKIAFLEKKTALHGRMRDHMLHGVAKSTDAPGLQEQKEREAFIERAFGSYKKATELLEQHHELAKQLRTKLADGTFERTMAKVLDAQIIVDDDDQEAKKLQSKPIEHRIAAHLLVYLPARYNHDRGILLEIEAQAGKHLPAGNDYNRPFVR